MTLLLATSVVLVCSVRGAEVAVDPPSRNIGGAGTGDLGPSLSCKSVLGEGIRRTNGSSWRGKGKTSGTPASAEHWHKVAIAKVRALQMLGAHHRPRV